MIGQFIALPELEWAALRRATLPFADSRPVGHDGAYKIFYLRLFLV
jgi:hypothetical protein